MTESKKSLPQPFLTKLRTLIGKLWGNEKSRGSSRDDCRKNPRRWRSESTGETQEQRQIITTSSYWRFTRRRLAVFRIFTTRWVRHVRQGRGSSWWYNHRTRQNRRVIIFTIILRKYVFFFNTKPIARFAWPFDLVRTFETDLFLKQNNCSMAITVFFNIFMSQALRYNLFHQTPKNTPSESSVSRIHFQRSETQLPCSWENSFMTEDRSVLVFFLYTSRT